MISKRIATSCVAASLALGQAAPAMADGDAVVGGIIGGIIGGVIVNEANKSRATRTTTSKKTYAARPSVSAAQREQNREVQTALNYFGYPAGTPDGALGPRSRSAIAQYQATLGYPATGQLTDYERSMLVGSYHRAIAGGAATQQQIATNPMGARGLLLAWRDEAAGLPPQGQMAVAPAPAAPAAPAEGTVMAFAPAEPVPAPPADAAPALPSFMGGDTLQASLASHCNKVSLMTSTNGGFTTVAGMTDPNTVLNEQFCLARTYAIAQGEEMAARISGFTPQQIAEQCGSFGPAMKEHLTALSLKPAEAVLAGVQGFALSTGMAPAQLEGTAKVCLSVGYRTDDMDVALASALLLATLGEGAYGELMGHHLAQGFGAAQRPDLALVWYDIGLDALAQGGTAVFVPGQPERAELIRKAAYALGGKADQASLPAPVPAALPSFAVPAEEAAPAAAAPAEPAPAPAPGVVAAAEPPAPSGDKLQALPAAVKLPFLLFRD